MPFPLDHQRISFRPCIMPTAYTFVADKDLLLKKQFFYLFQEKSSKKYMGDGQNIKRFFAKMQNKNICNLFVHEGFDIFERVPHKENLSF